MILKEAPVAVASAVHDLEVDNIISIDLAVTLRGGIWKKELFPAIPNLM